MEKLEEYTYSIDFGKEENISITLIGENLQAITEESRQIDNWLIIELMKLGLKDFRSKRKIYRFLKKNKIEVKYETVLSTLYLLKDNRIEAKYETNFYSEMGYRKEKQNVSKN